MRRGLAVLAALLLCVSAALAETPEPSGTEVVLAAEGVAAAVSLVLPEGFAPLEGEIAGSKWHRFENPATGVLFYADCATPDAMEQRILLEKVRDPSNRTLLFENERIGDYGYLAYCGALTPHMWIFLLLTEDGYGCRFDYYMPVGQGQDTPPEEARAILATLRLLDESGEPFMTD